MRFEDIDLARLGPVPDLVTVDYRAELDALLEGFTARWDALRATAPTLPPVDALMLETEPLRILAEEFAYRLTLVKAAYNDGVRAVMLASSWGRYLEHRAAEFGLTRRLLDAGDPGATPPRAPAYESDDDLRARRQMAIEAISNAGPYGAYAWFALNAHPQIKSVAVYGPESGLVPPGNVLIVVLDRRGDGTAGEQVLQAVRRACNPEQVRPLTEMLVTVQSAAIVPYIASVVIEVLPGPDVELIRAAAQARVDAYRLDRHRIRAPVTRAGYEAAATVLSADGRPLVERATATLVGGDLAPSRLQAAYAAAVPVTAQVLTDD